MSCTLYHRKYIWAKYKVQRSLKWIFLRTARKYSGLSCLIFLFNPFLKREVKWRPFKFNWKGKGEVLPLAGPLLRASQIFCILLSVHKCFNCDDANPICLCDSTLFVCLEREIVNWKFLFGMNWEFGSVIPGLLGGNYKFYKPPRSTPQTHLPAQKPTLPLFPTDIMSMM